MSARRLPSMVEELRSAFARALDAVADAVRGRKLRSTIECDVAELSQRVEDLDDSLAALDSRAGRDGNTLRPWPEIRR